MAFGSKWQALVPPFQVLSVGMMFRTSYRMSDSLSRATGNVYRRAWRQGLYAALVVLGAWLGQFYGVTGVATGVLVALFINFLVMAQLGLSVGQISWLRFLQVQLPAFRLTGLVTLVALAGTSLARYLGFPALVVLVVAAGASLAAGLGAASLAPRWFLGEHGMRMRDALSVSLRARKPPVVAQGSV